MLRAAIFSAFTAIFPDLIRPEYFLVVMPRNIICLACDTRNPEAMDHVVRFEIHCDYCPLRQVKGVSIDHMLIGIVEFPPPLVPDRGHSDLRNTPVCARNILYVEHCIDGACQHGEQKYRGHNRPDNFNRVIAMNLPWRRRIWSFTVAEN